MKPLVSGALGHGGVAWGGLRISTGGLWDPGRPPPLPLLLCTRRRTLESTLKAGLYSRKGGLLMTTFGLEIKAQYETLGDKNHHSFLIPTHHSRLHFKACTKIKTDNDKKKVGP